MLDHSKALLEENSLKCRSNWIQVDWKHHKIDVKWIENIIRLQDFRLVKLELVDDLEW